MLMCCSVTILEPSLQSVCAFQGKISDPGVLLKVKHSQALKLKAPGSGFLPPYPISRICLKTANPVLQEL